MSELKAKYSIGEVVWSTRLKQDVTITDVRVMEKYNQVLYDFAELGSGSPELESEDYLESRQTSKSLSVPKIKRTREFNLNEKEINIYEIWIKQHSTVCKYKNGSDIGAIGGRITFSFTGTSLGLIKKVTCSCGEEKCLNDFSDW